MAAVQIKDVPDELHEALRQRAAEEGTTIGAYVLHLIRRDLARPRLAAWLAELPGPPPAPAALPSGAELVAAGRAEHDRDAPPGAPRTAAGRRVRR